MSSAVAQLLPSPRLASIRKSRIVRPEGNEFIPRRPALAELSISANIGNSLEFPKSSPRNRTQRQLVRIAYKLVIRSLPVMQS